MLKEVVSTRGHPNVLSLHEATLEFTRDAHLTPRGDCIFAVGADKACADLDENFKNNLRSGDAQLKIIIECDGVSDTVTARGHPDLTLTHATDAVIRKSNFTCPRTLADAADKAASDLDRKLVQKLKEGKPVKILLTLSN